MTSSARKKTGSGGFDKSVIEAAQAALDQMLDDNGDEWVASQIDSMSESWINRKDDASGFCALVKLAIDLKCLAEGIGKKDLTAVAASLFSFSENAKPTDRHAVQLIELHFSAIRALATLKSTEKQSEIPAGKIVEELRLAAIKVVNG